MKPTIILLIIITFVITSCSDNVVDNNSSNKDNINNPVYYYSGVWENGSDSQNENYIFDFEIEFHENNNSWPKILIDNDSLELNACSIELKPFVYYGDTTEIKSNTYSIENDIVVDSLLFLEDGLNKKYQVIISKNNLSNFELQNSYGDLHLVLALYVNGGNIKNESKYDEINQRLIYANTSSTYYSFKNKKLFYSKFGN